MKQKLLQLRFFLWILIISALFRPHETVAAKLFQQSSISKVINVKDTLRVNFGRDADTLATGYLLDSGAAYGMRKNGERYGWISYETKMPIDLSLNSRNRGNISVSYLENTLIHMQYGDTGGSNGNIEEGSWELSLANGMYEVVVDVGDPLIDPPSTMPFHTIRAEGVNIINKFVPANDIGISNRFTSWSTIVEVLDNKLTLDAEGGFNTKINSVEIHRIRPVFKNVTPSVDAKNVRIDNFQINVEISTPEGYELDFRTLGGNVNLYELTDEGEFLIPSNANDTGGGDAITLTPINKLKQLTTYSFKLSSNLEVNKTGNTDVRIGFTPFISTFTTGESQFTPNSGLDLSEILFTKVFGDSLGNGTENQLFSSLTIGPDGKLYASTIGNFVSDGKIFRWDMGADGTLSNLEILSPSLTGSLHPVTGVASSDNRLIIGLVFDPSSTADNLIAYITNNAASISDGPEWDGKITRLTGPQLSIVQDIVINLPRSAKDHLTNSLTFDENGDLYVSQGSNSAGGEPDPNWVNRPERLLSGAVLKLELDKLRSLPLDVFTTDSIPVINAAPIDKLTMSDGTYNPYAKNSPLTIFASGVRNAYDLIWHSNGWLYIPTNGTAGNGVNSPNSPATSAYQLARRIDQLDSIPTAPALLGGETQKDWLFNTRGGSYHGHPNPYRGEFILNHGGKPYSNIPGQIKSPYTDVAKYPETLGPDPNYRTPAFDFGKNKSPNGVLEYKSNAFKGKLKQLLFVTRFSGQDDLIALSPSANGEILESYVNITGLNGFDDPLDIIEDPKTGNMYVSEYDRGGDGVSRLTLLRAAETAVEGPRILIDTKELIFEASVDEKGKPSDSKIVTIKNYGTQAINISEISINGSFADQFKISNLDGQVMAPNEVLELKITFAPELSTFNIGTQEALLSVISNDPKNPKIQIALYGLKKLGSGGKAEPILQEVLTTLGYATNVGWDTLESDTDAIAKGEEIEISRWKQANLDKRVILSPIARYSPAESVPFGWYTNENTIVLNEIGVLKDGVDNAQQLLPPLSSGVTNFNPREKIFGLFVNSQFFDRINYSQDELNLGNVQHRVRSYPAKDREGNRIENSYLIMFEDASNGDYQDYVFLLQNVLPIKKEIQYAYQFNFRTNDLSVPSPDGYINDTGAAFNTKNTTLGNVSFGWVLPGTITPADATNNARDRNTGIEDDILLKTFTTIGHRANERFPLRDWLIKVPNGYYFAEISVGEPDYSDSKHVLNVNGITVIDFDQETDNSDGLINFKNSELIEVTDGIIRLSLDNSGINAKPNYIRLAAANKTFIPPIISATFEGDTLENGNYFKNTKIILNAKTATGNNKIENILYQIDNNPEVVYTDPINYTIEGVHSLKVSTEDTYGNIAIENYTFSVQTATGAIIVLENLTKIPETDRGFPADDFYTFHRLGNNEPNNAKVHDTNIMRLRNTGTGTMTISEINLENEDTYSYEILSTVSDTIFLPIKIQPDSFKDVRFKFIKNTTKGVTQEQVEIVTNADNGTVSATLSGAFMLAPEGNREINAQQVINAFGFKTSMLSIVNDQGTIDPKNPVPYRPSSNYPSLQNTTAGYEGDMILSSTFVQADPNLPVTGIQLSALHGPSANGAKFVQPNSAVIVGGINFIHSKEYYQTLLPKSSTNNLINADFATAITEPFRIVIANSYATSGGNKLNGNRPDLLGIRVYKVKDRNGKIIANEYIAIQDFISNGCGAGSANCDWNDNVFYFTNIRPEVLPSVLTIDDFSIIAGAPFSYDISTYFEKGYPGNQLTFAISNTASTVSDWLSIDPITGIISGNAPIGLDVKDTIDVTIVATDANSIELSSSFQLVLDGKLFAIDDKLVANANEKIVLDKLLLNDITTVGDTIQIISTTDPINGTIVLNVENNVVDYTPNLNFLGSDQFTYTIENQNGITATATVVITIKAMVTTISLINTETNEVTVDLQDGAEIAIDQLESIIAGVLVKTNPPRVGSVVFSLSGVLSHNQTESLYPYSLFGDSGPRTVNGQPFTEGSYILTIIPYSAKSGVGEPGVSKVINFKVLPKLENPTTLRSLETEFNGVRLSPNPLFGYENIHISVDKKNISLIQLYNSQLEEIGTFNPLNVKDGDIYTLPVLNLNAGVYILVITDQNGNQSQYKLIAK